MTSGELIVIPQISGSEKDVEIALINITFRKKDIDTYQYPFPDFGAWLVNEILAEQKILANVKGFFNKTFFCSTCNAELNPDLQYQSTLELDLKHKRISPFQVRITMPFVKCQNCQKINIVDVKGVYGFRIQEALLQALLSGNIKPC